MFYHMFGANIGSLNVYTRTSVGGALKQVWGRSGNVADAFQRVEIQLYESQPFQVCPATYNSVTAKNDHPKLSAEKNQ